MLLHAILAIADESIRKRLRILLRPTDAAVEIVKGKRNLLARAARKNGDIIISDEPVFLEWERGNQDVLEAYPNAPAIIVITESESPSESAELIAAGCEAVLYAELADDKIRQAIEAVMERRQELDRATLTRRPLATPSLEDFVSESLAMQEFMAVVHRMVDSDTSLLILGETGVGKERLARAIHAEGPRQEGPFIAVNCGALPEALMESELFGHEQGAFTGATRSHKGSFELAHGGTIFLDEIGDMPLHLQVKLLRVLQDHSVRRVGGDEFFEVDVRVIAASNRDIEADVEASLFRRDLYYRLSVVTLEVPPLRDRMEDIPTLAASYLDYHRPRIGREVTGISDEVVAALKQYSWPGNVRELINVIERAILLCKGSRIELADLPPGIRGFTSATDSLLGIPQSSDDVPADWLERPLKELKETMVADLERVYLSAMLEATRGKIGLTAKRVGIEPRTLYDKMKLYGLSKEDFKPKSK